jgi:hypothetical protein
LWVVDSAPQDADHDSPAPAPSVDEHTGLFGARKRLRQVETDIQAVRDENRQLRDVSRAESDRAAQLAARLHETATRNKGLVAQLEDLASRYATLRGKDAVAMDREIRDTRQLLARLADEAQFQQAAATRGQREAMSALAAVQEQAEDAQAELRRARREIVETQEITLLQEAGIYEYRHPLADAVAYKSALEQLKDAIKVSAKNNHAITAATNWTVNNSAAEGQRMVRDFSKLMLRAYNAEADNCVRSMRPHRLDSSRDRLNKTRDIIARLGKIINVNISAPYHQLRIKELELTSDYLAKVEEEKERIRAERERQRDEQQARREFEREKARLGKEMSHWQTAMQRWEAAGEAGKTAEAQAKLTEISEAIRGVEEREANIRTGWVYVISNVGSFGPDVVKIGLTRRLDPLERVRELGDASVPFRFDVHAVIFGADAVSLETNLHHRLADRRVNRVNLRREFFYATPAEVLDVLREMGLQDNLVDYVAEPEAQEWRSSRLLASATASRTGPDLDSII